MSISLYDHERRIKALEDARNNGITVKRHYRPTGYEYHDYDNPIFIDGADWDMLVIQYRPYNDSFGYGMSATALVFRSLVDMDKSLCVGSYVLNSDKALFAKKEFTETYIFAYGNGSGSDKYYTVKFNSNPQGHNYPGTRVRLEEYALLKI